MDREDIITRVKADTGINTDEVTTLCQYHIDRIQDKIASGIYYLNNKLYTHDFSFLTDYAEINTVASYTTGTADVTQDSTAVTGTDTTWAEAMIGRLIKFASEDEYYEISAVGSTTSITLTSAYIGSTDTDLTYSIYKIYYPLASDFKQMKWAKQLVTPQKLAPLTDLTTVRYIPDEFDESGELYGYVVSGQDSSGYTLIRPLPYQTSRKRIYYCYEKDLATINITGGESIIPSKWHPLFLFGLEEIIWKRHDRAEKLAQAKADFNEMLTAFVLEDKKKSKDDVELTMAAELISRIPPHPRLPKDYPEIYY